VARDQLIGQISQSERDADGSADRKSKADTHLLQLRFERSRAGVDGYLAAVPAAILISTDGGDIVAEQSHFDVARAVYERKAQDKGLAAELEAAVTEFERQSARYETSHAQAHRATVTRLSEETDLAGRADAARETEQRANTAVEIARLALQTAQKSRPKPLGINERLELDPSVPRPGTAAEARRLCEERTAIAENLQGEIEAARLGMEDTKTKITAHKDAAREYTLLIQLTHPAIVSDPEDNTDLTGSPEGDASRVKSGKARFQECQKAEQDIAKIISNRTEQLDRVLRDERWQSHEVQMMIKLLRFTREELAANAGQTARDCEERRVGLEGKLQEIEAVRGSILEKLVGRAQEAARSLKHAERMSTLPDGAGAWSGHKFLRVRVPDTGDPAERKVLLDRLLDSWVQPQKRDIAIPSGAQLSFDCLMAMLNQREVDIEILKPETSDLSILNYQPVTRLASFSGGQRVTAAILLYCVIVRVRSDQGGMLGDCGFLMLDNPFGKASHFPLVDLQLKMASVMGVQLIYLTGINDLEALAGFPLRIRLRNNARAGTAGERLVQPEANVVEAVRLGEHPRI
jgi:hypothetical protein